MLQLSWSGFLERRNLFLGAVLTVAVGVALVQSSLLSLLGVAATRAPDGAAAIEVLRADDARANAVAVLGVTLGLAAFLAVFIIGSTFAFTVAQRRRDLALLRLVGAGRRHVRRLLLGEAVLLGLAGSVLGVLLGLAVQGVQMRLMVGIGLVPDGVSVPWRTWIVPASLAVGVLLAVSGVLLAARRAARVQPLEALRDTGEGARVMTRTRWVAGLVMAVGALVLVGLAPVGGSLGGPAMALTASTVAAIAVTLLGPVLVPAVVGLVPVPSRAVLPGLARSAARDDVRRTAATAAPLVVLVALVVGQVAGSASIAAAGSEQLRSGTSADLVVESAGPLDADLEDAPGVAAASVEVEVPVRLTTGSGEMADTQIVTASVVDPADYAAAHPGSGALDELAGDAVAGGPGAEFVSVGDEVVLDLDGSALRLPVVAATPTTLAGGPAVLLPHGVLPAGVLADGSTRAFVTLADGADVAATTAALAEHGTVSTVEEWLRADTSARREGSQDALVVVMGLGVLYAAMGLVNAVVVATAARRRELAVLRATGLTRRQVVGTAVLEVAATTSAGLVLGLVSAATTLVGVAATTAAVAGHATVAVPWLLIGAVVVGALAVTGVTATAAAWAGTRTAPVRSLAARE